MSRSSFCLCRKAREREKSITEHKGTQYFWFNWTRNKIIINKSVCRRCEPFYVLRSFKFLLFYFFPGLLKINYATVWAVVFTVCWACMTWSLVLIIVTLHFVWHCLKAICSKFATRKCFQSKFEAYFYSKIQTETNKQSNFCVISIGKKRQKYQKKKRIVKKTNDIIHSITSG